MEGEPKSYCVLRSVPALHVLNRPASNLSARSTESDPSTTRASPPGGGRGQRHPSAEPNPTPDAARGATRDEETVALRRGVLGGAERLAPRDSTALKQLTSGDKMEAGVVAVCTVGVVVLLVSGGKPGCSYRGFPPAQPSAHHVTQAANQVAQAACLQTSQISPGPYGVIRMPGHHSP
ncbi:unnamed protein product [Boreogadus saida]